MVPGRLWQARFPGSPLQLYFVEQPDYFERDDPGQGRGLYHFTLPSGQKKDYPDNCERYTFFCRAVLEAVRLLGEPLDVLHLNDWQTGLVPVYLVEFYRSTLGYQRLKTLFTIHNLSYQGLFWHGELETTGLDWRLFNYQQLEFYGQLNFLKAGIVFADLLSTVSPRYAQEIQTPYFGCGLEGVLAERRERLYGIVNGVDYDVWNPATDPHLAARYDADSVTVGKPLCKAALQRYYGLAEDPRVPILATVTRLVDQKGLNLIGARADALLNANTQLVVLGEGDPVYHRMLLELKDRYPDRVGLTLGFDEALAHQIEAGADIYLMPSLYEPSGLNQLYSLKYGTVPVVRATGGLADTITDCTPETLATGTATGFTFLPHSADAFMSTTLRAIETYRGQPTVWLQIMQTGMRQDWSWDRSAADYETLYLLLRDGGNTPPT
jgi:starch synthase